MKEFRKYKSLEGYGCTVNLTEAPLDQKIADDLIRITQEKIVQDMVKEEIKKRLLEVFKPIVQEALDEMMDELLD